MDSFYKTNKNYQIVLNEIMQSKQITTKNKKIIQGFLTSLQSENISLSRIKKYLTCLRNMLNGNKTSLDRFTRKDFEKHRSGFGNFCGRSYEQ